MQKSYQYGFSANHHEAMHDIERRTRKANTMHRVIQHALGDVRSLRVLDLGTSTGIIADHLSLYFEEVVGLDIDAPAVAHAEECRMRDNLAFLVGDGMQSPFADNTFDVVLCAQIYEHVPDANRLVDEIYRILKPGGVCYFAAGNRLMFMEPHYRLPLLSVLPKPLANLYMRLSGKGNVYYETHFTYWRLRNLVKRFERDDYTQRLVEEPGTFGCEYMVPPNTRKQTLARWLIRWAYWLFPGYIWLLRKPVLPDAKTC